MNAIVSTVVLALTATYSGSVLAAPLQELETEAEMAKLVWHADIKEARKVAAAEGKHVLVSFTGTGWCSWCRKLDEEIIHKPVFSEGMASRYVLVRLDFEASGDARKDLPFAKENDALKDALGVTAFPRVVLMTAQGVGYAMAGYERGGAGKYTDALVGHHDKAIYLEREVPKAASAIASAKSKEDASLAGDRIVKLLKEAGPHALAQPLVPTVRASLAGLGADPKREIAAIDALCGANVVDDALIDRAFQLDPKNEAGLPEAALAAAMRTLQAHETVDALIARAEAMLSTLIVHDPQVAAQLYGDCAYWIKNWQRDDARARMMASFALQLKPKDDVLRGMLQSLIRQ